MAALPPSHVFASKGEFQNSIIQQQQQSATTPTSSTAPPPQKKKRNQPGTPNPDAEVIALSPKTLMATNRFICEVCNKGFQREQNLQLHRRGHNLPWKLKQKTSKEVKRKVYLCPEPSCVHHEPSRALGDLTGIKKHYSRKHGEKKWKCEKCSKRYAVQSDWKAHSKTCGTREYRCDCGTLFSRRDSFITHRAFCDALAEETARHPMSSHLYAAGSNHINLGLSSQIPSLQDHTHLSSNILRLDATGPKLEYLIPPSSSNPSSFPPFFIPDANLPHNSSPFPNKSLNGLIQLSDLQSNPNNSSSHQTNLFNLGFFSGDSTVAADNIAGSSSDFLSSTQFNNSTVSGTAGLSSLYSNASLQQSESAAPNMSATALLQKAAQMGSTTRSNTAAASILRGLTTPLSGSSTTKPGSPLFSGPFGGETLRASHADSGHRNNNNLQGLMNSLSDFNDGQDRGAFGGFGSGEMGLDQQGSGNVGFGEVNEAKLLHQDLAAGMGGSDKLTLDFLGVGGMVRRSTGGGVSLGGLEAQVESSRSSRAFGMGRSKFS